MNYLNFVEFNGKQGGIRFDPLANSYIVWVRNGTVNEPYTDMAPVYDNGVDAQKRLDDEMLKDKVS